MKRYDIIIAGGGMAGLSLCYYLSQSSLRESSILLINREVKNRNDRTWCFWESGAGPFESIVFRKWQSIEFFSNTFSGPLPIEGFEYKMLRSIDFYEFIHQQLVHLPNLEVKYADIESINDTEAGGLVCTADESFLGNHVFDSISALEQNQPGRHNLLQHFTGWVITTERDCFTAERLRLMDFRVNQQNDCRFFYILPFDKRTALVEYTIVSHQTLPEQEYKDALHNYIDTFLDTGSYQINETEVGAIPMSDATVAEHPLNHVIRIGTSGGYTKPSTGYTFTRTQHALRELVTNLARTGQLVPKKRSINGWVKSSLDSFFLNVLTNNRHPADDIFTRLFAHNSPNLILRFMDEDTTVAEDMRIIGSMPIGAFVVAAFDTILKKLKSRF
ncbi:MAG: lycopene cyclase [Bacteroidetes bacterium]|nr:lycopene cyclase [Fibrella sp.]